jgi:dGTPase
MNWKTLLSAKRWGYEHRFTDNQDDARSEFQRDYDRLIFSSPFRRLQNKTQVFPLPGSVFVHNRLTHSLEVASVGRSLGRIFYNEYKKLHPQIDQEVPALQEVGNIVSAACLSHDLGNPAFGHSGEAAISNYFNRGKGQQYKEQVTDSEWEDLIHFEGNANALRVLTHAFAGKDPQGFGLTYATLGSIIKYPCAAIDGHNKKYHHLKKYGFFQGEEATFSKVVAELGLEKDPAYPSAFKRHPLVYLVEAADDICYNIIDLEDAHRLGILSYQEVEDLLMPLCGSDQKERLKGLEDLDSRVSLLRAKAINTLINACAEVFVRHQDAFLSGTFERSLIDAIPEVLRVAMEEISRISVAKIYNAPSVIQIEVAGYKVMEGLLEEFIPAYLNPNKSPYEKKLVALMPKQFYVVDNEHGKSDPQAKIDQHAQVYAKIRSVLDFVSGMTDIYAVELYRKIKGISFPTLD